ncbi:MAG TPA: UDP-N-acetylmuramoyl-L-alanine--D-glutamate ligase [Vicinamibacterales bacterium]|nr:UDP-N-acetylmuramoyl-L-alanine--D-glutamate ligase [Vicinamibacterales bacterium]
MTFEVNRKRVVVVGGGRSGRAAAELLVSKGAQVVLSDTASTMDGADELRAHGIAVELGPHRAEMLSAADLLVVSPGVPLEQDAIAAARAAGVPVIGEVELASRWLSGRVIAITGTKGKSTTTTLAARMLTEAGFDVTAGGNLGTALSAQVAGSRPSSLHVVEVSSFQLEATETFRPWIAVLLNLAHDHLDRHGSLEAYGRAKARVFMNQTPADWAVVNADDPAALALARGARARRFDFGVEAKVTPGVSVDSGHIVRRSAADTTPLLPLASVRLPGRHLLSDVIAAAAVGSVAGVPPAAMRRAVEGFAGLEHALERVAEINGVRFINDSKATNVVSARRAIESFDRGVVAIMGGRFKGGDLADLRDAVAGRVDAIVAIGEATPLIHSALSEATTIHDASSMSDAVRRAFALARPGGVVLLAPACASFDMFRDYAERGRAFKEEVGKLERNEG